eukprot:SAG25_NODE_6163_length_583_cov_0.931818_1_plen_44_part_10
MRHIFESTEIDALIVSELPFTHCGVSSGERLPIMHAKFEHRHTF